MFLWSLDSDDSILVAEPSPKVHSQVDKPISHHYAKMPNMPLKHKTNYLN